MAMVKPIVLLAVSLPLLLSVGCNDKKKVAIDPELQKQLDAFEKKMDDEELEYLARGTARTINASTDNEDPPTTQTNSPPAKFASSTITGDNTSQQVSPTADDEEWNQLDAPPEFANNSNTAEQLNAPEKQTAANPTERISPESEPKQVCGAFLELLESGDHRTATKFLTNVAQLETARANLILEAPGGPGCRTEIQPAKYATTERKVAHVECLLYQDGSATPISLTWVMRRQYNGWKISGMTIRLDQQTSPDLLSFENPVDLARIQQTVETETTIEFHPTGDLLGTPELTAHGKQSTDSSVKR